MRRDLSEQRREREARRRPALLEPRGYDRIFYDCAIPLEGARFLVSRRSKWIGIADGGAAWNGVRRRASTHDCHSGCGISTNRYEQMYRFGAEMTQEVSHFSFSFEAGSQDPVLPAQVPLPSAEAKPEEKWDANFPILCLC